MITHTVITIIPEKNGNDRQFSRELTFESRAEFDLWKRKNPFKWKHVSMWGQMPLAFYENRFDGSDAVFIEMQMSRLSDENRAVACKDYEIMYRREGRKAANTWLVEFCGKFGITADEYKRARREYPLPEHFQKIIEKLKKAKKRSRSKYSHIFND